MNDLLRKFTAFIFVAVFLLGGCSVQLAGSDDDSQAIRYGIASMPQNLDPRFATDASSERINQLLYARLVNFNEALLPVPGIADWQQTDDFSYIFRLKPERLPFSNGVPVTAKDVVATYRFVLDRKSLSPHRQSLSMIESVQRVDDETIKFHLKQPDPLFPAYLQLGIMPASTVSDKKPDEKPDENVLQGSGEFELISKKQNRLTIQRRSDKQIVIFDMVKDPTVRVLKLINGEIDLLQNDLSPEMVAYLRQTEGIKSLQRRGHNFSYIGFNLNDRYTGDKRIRKALAHAINRAEIIQYVFQGAASRAESVLPGSHWAGHDQLQAYPFNPDKARQILSGLGYGPENPLQLTYKTSTDPFRIKLATVIQHQLKAVGIEMVIKSYDWGTFFGDIKGGNFQMYSLSWVGINTPDIFNYVFHSESLPPEGANRGRYVSSQVDSLLATAKKSSNLEQQKSYYRQIQEIVHSDLPYIPLWYEDQIAFTAEDIQGYRLSANGNYLSLNDIQRSKSH